MGTEFSNPFNDALQEAHDMEVPLSSFDEDAAKEEMEETKRKKQSVKKEVEDKDEDEDETDDDDDDDGDGDGSSDEAPDDKTDEVAEDAEGDSEETEEDKEREQIRERRRQERRNRKAENKARLESLRRDNAAKDSVISDLLARVEGIERRTVVGQLERVEADRNRLANAYNQCKEQIRIATETNNGALAAEATERMLVVRQQWTQLEGIANTIRQRATQPQPLDARLAKNMQNWHKRNSWYDPNVGDTDSKIVAALDQQLSDQGWNPATEEYWEELDEQVKKYLPHRAVGGTINRSKPDATQNGGRKAQKSVVTGTARESQQTKAGMFKLSSERIKAMKDAGVWDDPVARNAQIKRYRDYDKQNGIS